MAEKVKMEYVILISLLKQKYIGKRHCPVKNAIKGIPSHDLKKANTAIKNLIKNGYLTPKRTGHDIDISINPRYLNEIKNIPEIKAILMKIFSQNI